MRLLLILFSIFGLSISSDGEVNFDDWSIDELALFPSVPIAAPWSEDEKCREDSRKLMINLKNKTFWAMQSKFNVFLTEACFRNKKTNLETWKHKQGKFKKN